MSVPFESANPDLVCYFSLLKLDVICSTIGAEAWVKKLKWDGLKNFLSLPRQPLKCGSSKGTKAFVRSYKNLHFYWILGAGHFVSLNIHMPHY
jgi:serine carboxypeptidase 1